ncbi:MAG TPA: cell filamentation protein Fic [Clostridiales bacterium]|nr:MAG: cell filamentation protein Fic [Clostridiales bacterium GWD2_32_59]HAN09321.1 cell filamentation protein Fic [Clostridiales bacterium]
MENKLNKGHIIIYQTEDGVTKINVRIENETVWLTQTEIVELFQTTKSNISEHIKHIFEEGELDEISVVRNFRTTGPDGKLYNKKYYNLDVIISIGYRVKSHRGVQFRRWASSILKEYIIKGFAMNDDLLKKAGGGNYFDELLQRIRDIRSSEKVFWRKVLDIYATSIDYDSKAEMTIKFFKIVQNKMHWAVHNQTAAEVVYNRADSEKDFMGLTSFKGNKLTKEEVIIAKNYLTEKELNMLNRIVTAYLEIAEIRALDRVPMYMKDWIEQIDEFLKMSRKEILTHFGKISAEEANEKALIEYEKYRERTKNDLSEVERHFIEALEGMSKEIKKIGNK